MAGGTGADVAVMARGLGGRMKGGGYSPAFIAAIIASASTIAALVPPSITAVVYGAVGNVSIAGLFMAARPPGVNSRFRHLYACCLIGSPGPSKRSTAARHGSFGPRRAPPSPNGPAFL